ncbi:MAG TPA: hypothetical protein VGQ15_03325 [Gaiellaceae bacterium]|nr:hypothetical protein [Gaiellaceae bacterium]
MAGAEVGSLAVGGGDRWSDLDLTFGVAEGVHVDEVLEDWTLRLADELDAVQLFDLPSGGAIYRVFLLPGCLQLDVSFAPAAQWGAGGPKFRLLFGSAGERDHAQPPPARELLGYGVHHVVRARFNIERAQYWQAEFWISEVRDYALSLACRRRGLPARYARGFDDLPPDVLKAFEGAIVGSLDREELLRALRVAAEGLLREADEARELADQVEAQLLELVSS